MKYALPGLLCLLNAATTFAADTPPNVVFILTDNHGAWTLGCYGNEDIHTPNIDQLAAEGTLFENSYSSNAVCSPTRATYLTGLMPSQHGVHSYLVANGIQMGPDAYNAIAEFRTLPEILAANGYACGLSGKWHLGDNLHPPEPFSMWVTMPHGHTARFYGAKVIKNGQVHKESTYLTKYWTDHAIQFIENNKDRPFFLYLAYNGPYGLGRSLLRPARNRFADDYADKKLPSFPRREPDPWLHNNTEYINNIKAIRRYAAEVSGVDYGVGRVMEALKANGVADNTVVVFTGDQGLAGGQYGFWGMGDHTRPISAYDWTMHVPLIWWHPGHIEAGQRSELLVSNYDFLPSLLDYLGLAEKQAEQPPSPGRSYAPVLRGEPIDWENVVFFEYETIRAVRTPEWKWIERFGDGPDELYHLTVDPGEQNNLVDEERYDERQARLDARLDAYFAKYANPKYDLWKGGTSKVRRIVPPSRKKNQKN